MMEDIELWQQVFQELIQEVKPWHKWTLTQDNGLLPDVLKPGWMQYQQKTFARFHCSCCSRSWASGCVLTIFHMHWCEKKGQGQVKMRVFAQRCNKCPEPPFAAPEFTWDNISRILNNLLFRILKKCYGEGFKQMDEIPLHGDTSLQGPHDSSNCEACLQGFCAQSGSGLASKPPARPLSPTPSKTTREPQVTTICSDDPRSQTSSKVEKPQASKVDPKASNPPKAALKVSHTSHPSTSILTIQQLSRVSSPTPTCVTQMPSPVKSSTAADAGKKTRSKTPKALPPPSSVVPPTSSSVVPPTSSSVVPPTSSSVVPPTFSSVVPPTSSSVVPPTSSLFVLPTSSLFVPPTRSFAPPTSSLFVPPTSSFVPPPHSYVVPDSWRPPANTACQVERSSHIHPPRESCREACCEACCEDFCDCGRACCRGFCNCLSRKPCQSLVFLFIVAVIVTLYIKYGI
uniref:Receptor transporter protein 3 n=1 Tax=Peromyscus maniculatus bairdii TaxID=230844 RepID=A0A8C8VWH3_PERMB|nr:receptor-transporting protein 3 isoform X1 [Peromyscus maniculatus bairdii]XP_042137719.1 receptor-transporting protein 3 isoform X1 [Peromyscus maniculatus bairdii]XP_042137720.1 receptor-transporting protein 3 isoform X1 [Peromyscus maniculatus bairdii]XP_042137721.1 receptor-transporting protein 3 isoform X1 [Peromyscus maniculatus bairdii]XP_042137722.1 receptor-transporting protein 3 isoform X1 [Peromyscus maniculatus bairdii]